jgi:hypothetical protein
MRKKCCTEELGWEGGEGGERERQRAEPGKCHRETLRRSFCMQWSEIGTALFILFDVEIFSFM